MELSKHTPLIPGAKDVIDMLQKEENELIIILARGGMIKEMKDVAMEKFEEENQNKTRQLGKTRNKHV